MCMICVWRRSNMPSFNWILFLQSLILAPVQMVILDLTVKKHFVIQIVWMVVTARRQAYARARQDIKALTAKEV